MASIFVLHTLLCCPQGFLQSIKNPSHLVLISRDFHHLVLSDNLNGGRANWMYLL
jgi:hypothetical protein